MFQEAPTVGWDYATVYVSIDAATRLLSFYVLFVGGALIFKTARVWAVLGFRSRRIGRSLDEAAVAIQKRDFTDLRTTVRRIGRRAPEAGLREWPVTEPDGASILEALRSAGRQFDHACDPLAQTIRGLKMWAVLTPLVFSLYSSVELLSLFRTISHQKIMGVSAIFGSLTFLMNFWQVGLWLTIAYFVAYWHFGVRLERRRESWTRFVSAATKPLGNAPRPPE